MNLLYSAICLNHASKFFRSIFLRMKKIIRVQKKEKMEDVSMRNKEEMLKDVKANAEENGYYVCPDEDLLDDLLEGLVENEKRYGYAFCPCRPASGVPTRDVDVICPCGYRVADIEEHGQCYCGLFVSKEMKENPSKLGSIPERRPKNLIKKAIEARKKNERGELDKEKLEADVRKGLE